MERVKALTNLRNNILPSDFLQEYPKESAFIFWLLSPAPEDRPTASNIVKADLLAKCDKVTILKTEYSKMKQLIQQQENTIEALKKEVLMLQSLKPTLH